LGGGAVAPKQKQWGNSSSLSRLFILFWTSPIQPVQYPSRLRNIPLRNVPFCSATDIQPNREVLALLSSKIPKSATYIERRTLRKFFSECQINVIYHKTDVAYVERGARYSTQSERMMGRDADTAQARNMSLPFRTLNSKTSRSKQTQ
jgi:hypothetical protein